MNCSVGCTKIVRMSFGGDTVSRSDDRECGIRLLSFIPRLLLLVESNVVTGSLSELVEEVDMVGGNRAVSPSAWVYGWRCSLL